MNSKESDNKELLLQIGADIKLATTMADISSTDELTALNSRMIGHLDVLESEKAKMEYKAKLMDGKIKTLKEFIRVGKMRAQEISINGSLTRKGY
jgi:hypothetical protein